LATISLLNYQNKAAACSHCIMRMILCYEKCYAMLTATVSPQCIITQEKAHQMIDC